MTINTFTAWLSSAQQHVLSLKAACTTQTKPIPLMRTRDEIGTLLNREPRMFVGLELGVQRGYFAQTTLRQWKKCKKYILVSMPVWPCRCDPSAVMHQKAAALGACFASPHDSFRELQFSLALSLTPQNTINATFVSDPQVDLWGQQKNYDDIANVDDMQQEQIYR